ncbi:MAG: MiaB/RimO family radical SAM methylthiotransferase [bacterium]
MPNKHYHITTFGCVMNSSDSERVATVAELLGYIPSDSIESAELIIINSCSIRQKAEDRVVGMGKKISSLKENKEIITILTGCMAKREKRSEEVNENKYEKNLKRIMPWLDYIVDIKDIHKLGNIIGVKNEIKAEEYLSIKPKTYNNFTRYIPISTGCNKFCTYCIVPFARGNEIYRPYSEIIDEINDSLKSGVKEIILLGQNVNSWRGYKNSNEYIESKDPHRLTKISMPENMLDFADLINDIGNLLDKYIENSGKKVWLRFTSSHPYDIDNKLIDVVKNHTSIAKQFHFALQSGNNAVLKRMNRHYTIENFIEKCNLIRNCIPGVGISTDIIVGFCGESNEEFQSTVDVVNELAFDQAFISEYSTRKGTVADRVHKDNITNDVKAKRKEILNDILGKGIKVRNQEMLNQEYEVLIYKKNKLGYVGRTESSKDVIISSLLKEIDSPIGKFVRVKIISCNDWSLTGELIK